MVMSMDAAGDQTMSSPIEDITMSSSGGGGGGGGQHNQESADEDLNEDEQSSKASNRTVVNNQQQQRVINKVSNKNNNSNNQSEPKAMVISREASLSEPMEEKRSIDDVDLILDSDNNNNNNINRTIETTSLQQQQTFNPQMPIRDQLSKTEIVSIKNDPLVARMREFVEGTTTMQTTSNTELPETVTNTTTSTENQQPKSSSDSVNNQAELNSKASHDSAQQQQKRSHRHHHSRSHCARHHHHHTHQQHHHHQHHRPSVSSMSGAQQNRPNQTILSSSGVGGGSSSGLIGHIHPHHHHHHHHHNQHHHHHNQHQHHHQLQQNSDQANTQHTNSHPHHHHHQHSHLYSGANTGNNAHNRHHHHHHHHHRVHKKRLISGDETGDVNTGIDSIKVDDNGEDITKQDPTSTEHFKQQQNRPTLQDLTSQLNIVSTASSYCPYHGLSSSATTTGPDHQNQHQHHHHHHHCSAHSRSLALKHHHHHHHHHLHQQQQSSGNVDASSREQLGSQQEPALGDETQTKKILNEEQLFTIRNNHNHHYHNHHRHHHNHGHTHAHGHHHHHHHHQHNTKQRHRNKNKSSSNTNITDDQQQDLTNNKIDLNNNEIPNKIEKLADASVVVDDKKNYLQQQESDNENKMNLDQSDEESKRHVELVDKSDNKASTEVVNMDMSPNNESTNRQKTVDEGKSTHNDEQLITTDSKLQTTKTLDNDSKQETKQQTVSNSYPSSGINAQELVDRVNEFSRNQESDSLEGNRDGDCGTSAASRGGANKDRLLRQMSSSRENSQKGPSGIQGSGTGGNGNRDGTNNRQQQEQQHQTIECSPIQPNTYQQPAMPKQIIESTVLRDRRCRLCWCCCCPCSSLSNKSNTIKSEVTKQITEPTISTTGNKCPSIPNVSLDEIRSWGESFEKLMKCPDGRKVFQDFLRCEYSEENILFWIACEDLKLEKDAKSVANKARDIYEDYISILSAKEVSLDSRVRDVINSNIKKPTSNIFDEAQLQIYTLMHRDSYPRFLNSAMYKKLAQIQTTSRKSSS